MRCATSTWGNESLATARMVFMSGGSSYVCTGTLMNDNDPSTYIPFFLTANHCIPTQTVASTLQTYWFYRASSCNSGSLSPSTQTLTGGATLLYASSVTDTSFMQLNSTPPAGALYSGWTANLPALNTPGTAIHNPKRRFAKDQFRHNHGLPQLSHHPGSGSYFLQVSGLWQRRPSQRGLEPGHYRGRQQRFRSLGRIRQQPLPGGPVKRWIQFLLCAHCIRSVWSFRCGLQRGAVSMAGVGHREQLYPDRHQIRHRQWCGEFRAARHQLRGGLHRKLC